MTSPLPHHLKRTKVRFYVYFFIHDSILKEKKEEKEEKDSRIGEYGVLGYNLMFEYGNIIFKFLS